MNKFKFLNAALFLVMGAFLICAAPANGNGQKDKKETQSSLAQKKMQEKEKNHCGCCEACECGENCECGPDYQCGSKCECAK
jgi:hypothetical protein